LTGKDDNGIVHVAMLRRLRSPDNRAPAKGSPGAFASSPPALRRVQRNGTLCSCPALRTIMSHLRAC